MGKASIRKVTGHPAEKKHRLKAAPGQTAQEIHRPQVSSKQQALEKLDARELADALRTVLHKDG